VASGKFAKAQDGLRPARFSPQEIYRLCTLMGPEETSDVQH